MFLVIYPGIPQFTAERSLDKRMSQFFYPHSKIINTNLEISILPAMKSFCDEWVGGERECCSCGPEFCECWREVIA